MEMMIVLLIVAIIAAATAPMVTKKMARNAGSGDSPWVFTGLNNNIAYNMSGANASAIIGATNYSYSGNQPRYPRLVLAANGADHPALVFAGADGAYGGQINMDPGHSIVTMNDQTVGEKSVAFGYGQSIGESNDGVVAIGEGVTCGPYSTAVGRAANARESRCVAIGTGASSELPYAIAIGTGASSTNSAAIAIGKGASTTGLHASDAIAIGTGASTTDADAIAIGTGASAKEIGAIAIGNGVNSTGSNSIAIGGCKVYNSKSTNAIHNNSVAIGAGAETTTFNQIVLGTDEDTVYIPGHLVAQDIVATRGLYFVDTISGNNRGLQLLDQWRHPDGKYCAGVQRAVTAPSWLRGYTLSGVSDRRLKNVGEKYTAGLDELKKLDFYHYTFKKDEAKTPMVGVMAQDLQKVFPDAVTKGEDGYLRIRLEDMFYAVINAVKELDNKISEIVADITSIKTTIKSQQETIDSLQKENAELKEEIKSIEKRIEKLEK